MRYRTHLLTEVRTTTCAHIISPQSVCPHYSLLYVHRYRAEGRGCAVGRLYTEAPLIIYVLQIMCKRYRAS